MSNESKFLSLQGEQEVCKKPEPEFPEPDRVCPTCIPNESFTPPHWWTVSDPWLNERTCEYNVAVTINQHGRNFRLSDLREFFDSIDTLNEESEDPTLNVSQKDAFRVLLKSFIRPGVRRMLRYYDKMESDAIVCAAIGTQILTNDLIESTVLYRQPSEQTRFELLAKGGQEAAFCGDITGIDTSRFLSIRTQIASMITGDTFQTQAIDEALALQYGITNPNALELHANAPDYHFHGLTNNTMSVLITIPAHIFDQVPNAPSIPDTNVSVGSVKFNATEFSNWIVQMERTFRTFSQFQAIFKQSENGRVFQVINDTELPFYITNHISEFKQFEDVLINLIEEKGYGYPGGDFLSTARGILSLSGDVEEIELFFNNEDPARPYRLDEKIKLYVRDCNPVICKLPPEPEEGESNIENIRAFAYNKQTVMGYIANYNAIKDSIEARQTPPWIDFMVQYTFPPLVVNYGSSEMFTDQSAINCLVEDHWNQLDDYILDATVGMFDAFAYQLNKNTCRLLNSRSEKWPIDFDEERKIEEELKRDEERMAESARYWEEARQYEQERDAQIEAGVRAINERNLKKMLGEQTLRKVYKDKGLASTIKLAGKKGWKASAEKLGALFNAVNPCNWEKVVKKGIRCLLSGMTVEEGYRALLKASIGALSSEGLEMLIEGLPMDSQQNIRNKVQEQFKDMPAPWEAGWQSGDVESAFDRAAAERIAAASEGRKAATDALQQTVGELQPKLDERKKELARKDTPEYYDQVLYELIDSITHPGGSVIEGGTPRLDEVIIEEIEQLEYVRTQELDLIELAYKTEQAREKYDDSSYKLNNYQQELEELQYDSIGNHTQEDQIQSYVILIESQTPLVEQDRLALQEAISNEETATNELKVSQEVLEELQKEKEFLEKLLLGETPDRIKNLAARMVGDEVSFIESEIKRLEQAIQQAEQHSVSATAEAINGVGTEAALNWDSMTPEEKEQVIQAESDKRRFVTLNREDKIKQGTLGRALGNVQKEVYNAYVDAIMQSADVTQIMNSLNRLPGAAIVTEFFSDFDCPANSIWYPPIDSFLNTLTSDPCGPGKQRGPFLPMPDGLFFQWSFYSAAKDAAIRTFKMSMSGVIASLMAKVASTLEAAVCKTLAGTGQLGLQAFRSGNTDFGETNGLMGIIDKVICEDQLNNEKDRDNAIDNFMQASGVPPMAPATSNAPASSKELVETLTVLGSEDDFAQAMVLPCDEQDREFLENLARTVTAVHPEYAGFLGDPDKMCQFLQQAGNLLTPEQRQEMLDKINQGGDRLPLDSSICLTNEDAQAYFQGLEDMFCEMIGNCEIASDFVERAKDRAKGDLGDLADALAKGPSGIFQEQINKAFAQPDPDCDVDNSLLKPPQELQSLKIKAVNGIFSRLQKAFIDDTIEENMLERGLSFGLPGLGDSMGVLLYIMADTVGYNLSKHIRVRTNIMMMIFAWMGFFDNEAPFPETVGAYMRNQLLETEISYEGAGFNLEFTDEYGVVLGDKQPAGFKSNTIISDVYQEDSLIHHQSFDYRFSQNTPDFNINSITVSPSFTEDEIRYLSDNVEIVIEDLEFETPDNNWDNVGKNSYKNLVFKNILNSKLAQVTNTILFTNDEVFSLVNGINTFVINKFVNTCLKDQDGGIPQGFLHGGSDSPITLEDLTYVDPFDGATSYTLEESDMTLGRSMTNNPRVKFLNPARHGGTYEYPNIYIEPENATGWMSLSKLIVPNIDGCEPKSSNFLRLHELEEKIPELESKIKENPDISKSPECLLEVPFNKVASKGSLAIIESTVYATIRVYLAEMFINGMPIFSNVAMNDKNYDNLLLDYIVERMQEGLSQQGGFFVSTYEKFTYWLLFLEQCVQVYDRKVKSGEIKPTSEAEIILESLKTVQTEFDQPTFETINNVRYKQRDSQLEQELDKMDSWSASDFNSAMLENLDEFFNRTASTVFLKTSVSSLSDLESRLSEKFGKTAARMLAGCWIIGDNSTSWLSALNRKISQGRRNNDFYSIGAFNAYFMTLSMARLGSKVFTILENMNNCKKILSLLVKDQMQEYSTIFARDMPQRPVIYDINKYFLSKMTLGSTLAAGTYDIEVPIGEANLALITSEPQTYGDVINCSVDGKRHPLIGVPLQIDNMSQGQTESYISQNGGFYIEKYLRIIEKTEPVYDAPPIQRDPLVPPTIVPQPEQNIKLPKFINERPDELKNVVNIQEFRNFLLENKDKIKDDVNISDYFGDAYQTEKDKRAEKYSGSIGIKFGVRICLIPPSDAMPAWGSPTALDAARREKSFIFTDLGGGTPGSAPLLPLFRHAIPLASYEQDVKDVKLKTLADATDDFNEDLKCYIDKLVDTPEYKIVFDKIINLRRIPSILACYSNANFIASLTYGEGERRVPDLGGINIFDLSIDDAPDSDDRGNSFNDSKNEARKLFISAYKRNDFDFPEVEFDIDWEMLYRNALSRSYNYLNLDKGIPWWVRRRIKPMKPTDKFGKECENAFGRLFNIKF